MLMRYVSEAFVPTANRTGNDNSGTRILRGTNFFIRGRNGDNYSEIYGGSLDLDEDIPTAALTGTIAFLPTSQTVVGTGTLFLEELHLGQRLETLAGEIIVVQEVSTNLSFTACSLPLTTESGVVAHRLPVLFPMDKARGTLWSGNALEFDRGTIMAVGSGPLRRNGALLTDPLTANQQVQIAIYDPATNTYLIQTLGFSTVPFGITVAAGTAPTAKTFTDADVNTGTNRVTIAAHGYVTGQEGVLTNPGTLPVPLEDHPSLYVIRIDANTVEFADTLSAAYAGSEVDITNAGAGTNTFTPVSKNMPAGDYSIRVAKASDKLGTPTYGNPGQKIKLTLTAGQAIQINFPAMDSDANPNDPHDAWRIYASRHGGSTTIATASADSGPWYYVRTVTSEELDTTGAATYYLEYLDAEIDGTARLISFDNDYPPRAEFVATVAGYPLLVSCQGKGTTDYPDGDSPGSSIVPFKINNLAAAPLVLDSRLRNEVPLSPPENIIGFYIATGRLYLMTANTLQIGVFTADAVFPVATRPFWQSGFKNPYALCFANDRLYGFTNVPIRSPLDGSDSDIDRGFAADVLELMKDWKPENVFVIYDPQNNCVCYVNSGAYKNDDGFWVSEIVPLMLDSNSWSHTIVYSSPTEDMIISGVATVNGHFEFLRGGRDGLGGTIIRTHRFDTADSLPVTGSQGWQFADGGSEDRPKKVKHPRVTGLLYDANIGIHGAAAGEIIDIDALEAGNAGSKSGAIALESSPTGVEYRPSEQVSVGNLMAFTLNIVETWPGTGEKSRIDEAVCQYLIQGARR